MLRRICGNIASLKDCTAIYRARCMIHKNYIEVMSILPSGEFVKSLRDLDVSREVPPWRLFFPDGVLRGWNSMLLKTL